MLGNPAAAMAAALAAAAVASVSAAGQKQCFIADLFPANTGTTDGIPGEDEGTPEYEDAIIPSGCDWLALAPDDGVKPLGDPGAEAVVNALLMDYSSEVIGLSLGSNDIGLMGASAIAGLIANNRPGLADLYIGHNPDIGDEGVESIASALAGNTELRVIDLSDVGMSDRGAAATAEALRMNTHLSELWLRSNNITNKGLNILYEVLECCNEKIQTITIDGNPTTNEDLRDRLLKLARSDRTLSKINDEL